MLSNNSIITGPQLMPAPRADRPHRRESFWLVRCKLCGKTRWLRQTDMQKDRPCIRCAAVGSTTVTSAFEDRVAAYLSSQGVSYERHVPIYELSANIDFRLADGTYLEVRGYHHRKYKQAKDTALQRSVQIVFVDTLQDVVDYIESTRKEV